MGKLFQDIREAVVENKYIVSWHADERCEERGISSWQLIEGIKNALPVAERASSKPNPSVVVRQILASGMEVEVVWAWLARSGNGKLVTVYFKD